MTAFDTWLLELAATSSSEVIRHAPEGVGLCLADVDGLPPEFPFNFVSADQFVNAMRRVAERAQGTPEQALIAITRAYWTDQAHLAHAYNVMVLRRSGELLRPCINGLNEGELVGPAVLARALLELGCSFTVNATAIDSILRQALALPDDEPTLSPELEDTLLRAIWGRRAGEPEDSVLFQRNILGVTKKLSKGFPELWETYEYLCELAHPNCLGHQRFWGLTEELPDGTYVVRVDRSPDTPTTAEIRERVLWSVGWAAAQVYNLSHRSQRSVVIAYRRWGGGAVPFEKTMKPTEGQHEGAEVFTFPNRTIRPRRKR